MKHHAHVFFLVILISFFGGCVLFRSSPQQEEEPPIFAVYYAYPRLDNAPEQFTPVPAYPGAWPEERQLRDISRIQATRIQGLLLFIHPKDLANTERFQRLESFLAKAQDASLAILLALHADSPMRLHSEDLTSFLEKRGLLNHPALFRFYGKPLLVLSENILLAGTPPSLLTIRKIGEDWHLSGEEPELTGDNLCWIDTAKYQDGEWLRKRRKRAFRARLKKAISLNPEFILLSSWNCYQDGSAIEFNTLDSDVFLKQL